jgi:PAS domain S-box-containing protein
MKIKTRYLINAVLLSVFFVLVILVIFLRFKLIVDIKSDENLVYELNRKVIKTDPFTFSDGKTLLKDIDSINDEFGSAHFKKNYPELGKISAALKEIINDVEINADFGTREKIALIHKFKAVSGLLLDLSFDINLEAKSASELLNYVYFISIFVFLITIINLAITGNTIFTSINKLISGINSIKDGLFSERIKIKGKDEFRTLSDAINSMALKLQETYDILQDEINLRVENEKKLLSSESRYRLFFEKNDAIMIMKDIKSGVIVDANPAATQYYGCNKDELIGRNMDDINVVDDDEILRRIYERISGDENHFFMKQRNTNGGIRYVEIFQTLIIIEERKTFLSIIFDITENILMENRLEKSREDYRLLLNNVNDSIFIYTLDEGNYPSDFVDVNNSACRTLGYSKEELLDMNIFDISLISSRQSVLSGINRVINDRQTITENLLVRKDKCQIPVEINSNLVNIDGKNTIILISHDISDRKKREELLIKSRDEYMKILNDFPNPIMKSNENRKFDYFNSAWFSFTGMSGGGQYGEGWMDSIHGDDRPVFRNAFNDSFDHKKTFESEIRLKHGDGTYHWVSIKSIPFYNMEGLFKGYIASCYDINDIKISNNMIRESLKEKDLLIKEIHHRVKNNLQIIQSLLNLQMLRIDSDEMKEMMRVNQDRIKSMALIHESVYQSGSFTKIDFDNYLRYICLYLVQSYDIDSDLIKVNINVNNVFLKIDTSIPLGLIINELISNSLKHSFADGRCGEIDLSIVRISDNRLVLRICDDGIEFPNGFDINDSKSFGYVLVNNLVKQLDGSIQICRTDSGKNEIKMEFVEE